MGKDYYVSGYRSLQGGSTHMDVLVALGSSTAYFYSIPVTLGLLGSSDGMMGSTYVYFKTAAVIITLIVLVKLLEARAKGRTSEPIKKLMGMRPHTARIVRGDLEMECRSSRCAWATSSSCGPARSSR